MGISDASNRLEHCTSEYSLDLVDSDVSDASSRLEHCTCGYSFDWVIMGGRYSSRLELGTGLEHKAVVVRDREEAELRPLSGQLM